MCGNKGPPTDLPSHLPLDVQDHQNGLYSITCPFPWHCGLLSCSVSSHYPSFPFPLPFSFLVAHSHDPVSPGSLFNGWEARCRNFSQWALAYCFDGQQAPICCLMASVPQFCFDLVASVP